MQNIKEKMWECQQNNVSCETAEQDYKELEEKTYTRISYNYGEKIFQNWRK